MSEEQRQILQMVAEGKVTADEGARLLEALETGERKRREHGSPARMAREKKRLMLERMREMDERKAELHERIELGRLKGLDSLKDIGRTIRAAIAETLPGMLHGEEFSADSPGPLDEDSPLMEETLEIGSASRLIVTRKNLMNAGGSLMLTGIDGSTIERIGEEPPDVRYSIEDDTVFLQWDMDDLSLSVPKSLEEISVRLLGGDIVVSDLPAELSLSTKGGDLGLYDVSGAFKARTMGGNVMIRLGDDWSHDSRASTMGGDISLSIPHDTNAVITGRTMGGDIMVDEGMPLGEESGQFGSSTVSIELGQDEEAPGIRLKTMGGNISIAWSDADSARGTDDEEDEEDAGDEKEKSARRRGKK